ncbi:MAG: type II secretion system protein GspJ [Candidatus Hydrogenedentales bacterium]|jgi:type II secretion system protein J
MTATLPKINRAFTLFELLLAVSLLSLVSTIGATAFFKLTRYWGDVLVTQRLNHQASLVFEVMTSDFENMVSSKISGAALKGQHLFYEDTENFWRLRFEDDRIAFPVAYNNPATQRSETYLVRYAIEREQGEATLVRYTRLLSAAPDEETAADLFPAVTGIHIEYSDGTEWRDSWEEASSPLMLQVSLSLMEGARVDKHLSRISTFPIYVN